MMWNKTRSIVVCCPSPVPGNDTKLNIQGDFVLTFHLSLWPEENRYCGCGQRIPTAHSTTTPVEMVNVKSAAATNVHIYIETTIATMPVTEGRHGGVPTNQQRKLIYNFPFPDCGESGSSFNSLGIRYRRRKSSLCKQ